ncbi:hypothetical protein ACJJI4_12170 [Microbulbifer sp. TRSA002]|uniref:hypothetical protein n=1 Tax=Microbulbifer sp. TRSA002 TaxID=3243382 RepID=UPI00403972F9
MYRHLKYKKWIEILSLILFFTGIQGCVSVGEMEKKAFEQALSAKTRVESSSSPKLTFKDLEYRTLSNGRLKVELAPNLSPIVSFPTGNSYTLPIKLPDRPQEESLIVRSEMSNAGRNRIPTVFVPYIQFLDKDKNPVEGSVEIPLCFYRGDTAQDVGYFGRIEAFPRSAKYAVIFTDVSKVGETVSYGSSATTTSGASMLPVTMSVTYNFPQSPEGHLDVWFMNKENTKRQQYTSLMRCKAAY